MNSIIEEDKAVKSVLSAIEAVKRGEMVIMVDDEDRENEGDLVFAAEHVDSEKVNFMAKEARGLICLTLDHKRVDSLGLPLMAGSGGPTEKTTAFTVSIEAREGVTTGISAADRARTIQVAVDKNTRPEDLVVPGHIFPLRAKPGGVLERAGHTEGSVDLARLAGVNPSGVICEIMKDDGSMARLPDLRRFSDKFKIPIVSIADLIKFRLLKDSLIEQIGHTEIQIEGGPIHCYLFHSLVDSRTHFAMVKGKKITPETVVDVRVHRQRPLLDVFGKEEFTGANRIRYGLDMLKESEHGVFLYLGQEIQPDPFREDFEAFVRETSKNRAKHSFPMDQRLYGIGAQILFHLGVRRMCLHLTAARPLKALAGFGLEVVETRII